MPSLFFVFVNVVCRVIFCLYKFKKGTKKGT